MSSLELDATLAKLLGPRPNYASIAAQNRFLHSHLRSWSAAVAAATRTPGAKQAAQLQKVLGDVGALQLRHFTAEVLEEVRPMTQDSEAGLQLALQAAACTPSWDPIYLAWSLRGIGVWLHRLGRVDEARDVVTRMWRADPWYPYGRETAKALGFSQPKKIPAPTGDADLLRLAGHNVLLEGFRTPNSRRIAMAMAQLWVGDRPAAAAMACGIKKPDRFERGWLERIAAFSGTAPASSEATAAARQKTVRRAIDKGEVDTLGVLALDPDPKVMLAAWIGLATVGAGTAVRGLLEEMIAATTVGRSKAMLAITLEEALACMPAATERKAANALELTRCAIQAIKKGAAAALPREATPLKPSTQTLPPSLAAWLAFGGLPEPKIAELGALAKRAHGPLFDGFSPKLLRSAALALEIPETAGDTLTLLALDYADSDGEAPVLALDVSEEPAVSAVASSFGAWLAADVGTLPATFRDSGLSAITRRILKAPRS